MTYSFVTVLFTNRFTVSSGVGFAGAAPSQLVGTLRMLIILRSNTILLVLLPGYTNQISSSKTVNLLDSLVIYIDSCILVDFILNS